MGDLALGRKERLFGLCGCAPFTEFSEQGLETVNSKLHTALEDLRRAYKHLLTGDVSTYRRRKHARKQFISGLIRAKHALDKEFPRLAKPAPPKPPQPPRPP